MIQIITVLIAAFSTKNLQRCKQNILDMYATMKFMLHVPSFFRFISWMHLYFSVNIHIGTRIQDFSVKTPKELSIELLNLVNRKPFQRVRRYRKHEKNNQRMITITVILLGNFN